MNRAAIVEQEIAEYRKQLSHHRLYQLLSDIDDIRIFMEQHVYAVWDFMSLLKALQQQLTCTTLPWQPSKNAKTARFINEIVWAEESDVNELGEAKSHFEMYLDSMDEVQANTSAVLQFISSCTELEGIEKILQNSNLQAETQSFLAFTFEVINTQEPHKVAAAFTFGREELIPDMFLEIIKQAEGKKYPKLTYYLERHIELDGDEHGPLALEMIQELCGNDDKKWNEVIEVAKLALIERINLWNGIANSIEAKAKLQEDLELV